MRGRKVTTICEWRYSMKLQELILDQICDDTRKMIDCDSMMINKTEEDDRLVLMNYFGWYHLL